MEVDEHFFEVLSYLINNSFVLVSHEKQESIVFFVR